MPPAKSMYVRPSTSSMRAPSARATTSAVVDTPRATQRLRSSAIRADSVPAAICVTSALEPRRHSARRGQEGPQERVSERSAIRPEISCAGACRSCPLPLRCESWRALQQDAGRSRSHRPRKGGASLRRRARCARRTPCSSRGCGTTRNGCSSSSRSSSASASSSSASARACRAVSATSSAAERRRLARRRSATRRRRSRRTRRTRRRSSTCRTRTSVTATSTPRSRRSRSSRSSSRATRTCSRSSQASTQPGEQGPGGRGAREPGVPGGIGHHVAASLGPTQQLFQAGPLDQTILDDVSKRGQEANGKARRRS